MAGAIRSAFSLETSSSRSRISGRTVLAEQLEGRHGRLMRIRVDEEHALVDAGGLVALAPGPQHVGGADRAPVGSVGHRGVGADRSGVHAPQVGVARGVHTEVVVVHDPEAEEPAADAEVLDGLLLGVAAHERHLAADGQHVGVDGA